MGLHCVRGLLEGPVFGFFKQGLRLRVQGL